MKKITLIQEPGFLRDLYYIFWLKFNSGDISVNKYCNNEEDSQNSREVLCRFGSVSDDLFVFFRVSERSGTDFIYTCYLKTFEKDIKNKYNIESLQKDFSNHSKVIKKMVAFYFCDIEINDNDNYETLQESLFEQIKKSNYSTEEKIKLYEFFINPNYYIDLFKRELIEKYLELSDYYKDQYKKIIDAYDPISIGKMFDELQVTDIDKSNDMEGYVSFCLLDHLCFKFVTCHNNCFGLLGVNYNQDTRQIENDVEESLIENFCNALCEKNRINILKLLYEKGEVSCKELERYFDFSGSTAYHHISLMNRMGVVQTRTHGKTVYYRINKKTFYDINSILKRFYQ